MFKQGDRVRMRYTDPPLSGDTAYAYVGWSVSICEGELQGFSIEPVRGYPRNAQPHATSVSVVDDYGFEHRAPLNRIIDLSPCATVKVDLFQPKGTP